MICPRCKNNKIFFLTTNKKVSQKGEVTFLKKYTCLSCNYNFDFPKDNKPFFYVK